MKRLITAAAATLALALGACATATPYQPIRPGSSASSGGFSERQIEENRWAVTFSGNSLTDRRTVETYLLYRAAELTLEQGYDWFAIVDRATDRETHLQSTYDPFYYNAWGWGGWWGPSWRFYGPRYGGYYGGWGAWGPWGYGGPWYGSAFDYREVTRYEATAEIFLGKGPKAADDRRSFDAREVTTRLASAIVRPEVKS